MHKAVIPVNAPREVQEHSIRQDAIYGFSLDAIAVRNSVSIEVVEEVLRTSPDFKDSVAQRKRLALSRLDLATKAVMPGLIAGNIGDINAYLKIQEREAKLTGMEAPVKQDSVITIDVPWLTRDRLAYKNPQGETVENVTDITPILEVKKAVEGWKEPTPDGLAQTMRDFGGKPKD